MPRTIKIVSSLLIILLLSHRESDGMELKFRYYNVENGMPSNTVNCIYQDTEGFIWFGTDDGLVRFDTYGLRTWRNDPENTGSIGCNSIYCLHEDKEGTLWIGTERGAYIYDRNLGVFSRPPVFSGLEESCIKSMTSDMKGRIWFSTLGNGIIMYDKLSRSSRQWRASENGSAGSIGSDYVPEITADSLGNLWCIPAGSYLYRYNDETEEFDRFLIRDSVRNITAKNAYSLCTDYMGNLWIAGWDSGIFHFDRETGEFRNYLTGNGIPVLSGRIHTITEAGPGILLIGSDGGMTSFNTDSGEYDTFSYSKENDRGLSDNFVHDILKDSEGGLWVATYFGGVNYSNPGSRNFMFRTCSPSASTGRVISRFCESPEGKIYIGTDDAGLFVYDPEKDITMPVQVDPENANLNIHALLIDGPYLWIGTYSNGLYRLNRSTSETEHYPRFSGNENSTDNDSVYSLHKDRNGAVWIGTKTGICSLTRKGFMNIARFGFNCDIIEIQEDSEGEIWFASITEGLIGYDPRTQQISQKQHRGNIPSQIMSMCVYRDRIWIGSAGRGLFMYDLDLGQGSKVVLSANGALLQDLTIFQIINRDDDLWMTTNKGLVRYSTTSGNANIYTVDDGLYTNIFNCNSGIIDSSGKIYLGANGGFNIFNPAEIFRNTTTPPRTVLTGYEVDGDSFSADFVALSYISPQRNRYRYALDGYDSRWNYTTYENNHARWESLPAGKYVFKVQSCNNEGIWGPERTLDISIESRWMTSTVTISLYVTAVLFMLATIAFLIGKYSRQKQNPEEPPQNQARGEILLLPEAHSLPEKDKKFIGELDSIIESNISDPNLSVGDIAQMMYVSRSVLFSRVKTVTGITPNNYVKIKRLEKAAGYIMTRKYKINEICYLVGFNTPSYFTKCFFERFGVLPKDFNPGVHSEKDGEDA